MSTRPGPTRSSVGKTLDAVVVETVTGLVHVAPWSLLAEKRIATLPPFFTSPHVTYTFPSESTFTGWKFHSVSNADPVEPVPGLGVCVHVSAWSSERATPTPPPAPSQTMDMLFDGPE